MSVLSLYFGYLQQYGVPYYNGGSDDLFFEEMAREVIYKQDYTPNQIAQDIPPRADNSVGFIWLLSWLMRLSDFFGGYHTIAYRILNIYFMIASGVLVASLFSKHYAKSERETITVLMVSTLFPNIVFISSHVFRDTLSTLLLFAIYYYIDYLIFRRHINLLSFIPLLPLSYLAYWVRRENILLIAFVFFIALIFKKKEIYGRKLIWAFAAVFVLLIVFDITGLSVLVKAYSQRYSLYLMELSDGLSRYVFGLPLLPFGLILRVLYGLVSPIPIPIFNIPIMFDNIVLFTSVIRSAGTIIQILFLPFLIINFKKLDRLSITFLMFLLVTVLTTFTFRHFLMIYPYMIILIFRKFSILSERKSIEIFQFRY